MYFSYDLSAASHHDNRPQPGPVVFSLDACGKCSDKISATVVSLFSPTRVGVDCELCGIKLRGAFDYFAVAATKVTVRRSCEAEVCGSCGEASCRCGMEMIKKVPVDVDSEYLKFSICQTDYKRLIDMVEATAKLR